MVDVQEAAILASRSPETIRRWVWSGKIHSVKYGTKLLVARADVSTGPPSAAGAGEFADWVREVNRRLDAFASSSGGSAAALVLEDRDERSGRASS